MGSDSSRSSFFSISLLFTIIMTIVPVNQANNDAEETESIFKSGRNMFNSLFVLSQLSDNDRVAICAEFGITNIITPSTIQFVYLVPGLYDPQFAGGYPYIPVIRCIQKQSGKDLLYVTVATTEIETPFFLLKKLELNVDGIHVQLKTSKAIPLYQNNLENVENKVTEYFKSENYQITAEKFFRQVQSIYEVKKLCNPLRKRHNASEIHETIFAQCDHQHVTFYENKDAVKIKTFPCLTFSNIENDFYASYYIDDIVFKVYKSNDKFITDYDMRVVY